LPLATKRGTRLAIGVEAGGPLGQARQEGRLGRCQQGGCAAEIDPAGGVGSDDLVPVRRETEIQRENLPLGELMLEPYGQEGLAQLQRPGPTSSTGRGFPPRST